MNDTEDYHDDDARLVQALREYQAALDEGRRPSRLEFIARHPDIAAALAECLDGLEFLRSATPRLQPAGPAAEPPRLEGRLGDFQVVREIGRGGMGVVYEAVQISLGRRVALKVLPFAATLDPRQLQRFENEARAAAHLHHPNIVPVFAVGSDRGVHYYAMQLIDGQTLAQGMQNAECRTQNERGSADTASHSHSAPCTLHSAFPAAAFFRGVATLGVQAAEALEYAHQMGIVHRDIKPGNLLLDGRGNLWVTDFGLARFQASPTLTSPGDLVGTLRYMSPEQAAGQPVLDPRSDVYSLGVTLYEVLAGQPAFPSTDRRECLHQILEQDPPAPRRFNRAIPVELETVVLKAMAKHPDDRYGSAKELADDLRCFLDDRPVRARRPGWQDMVARWARRHRRFVGAAVLALVIAVLALGVTTWRVASAEARTRQAYKELQAEKAKTSDALEKEVAQRDRAERNYRQARKVLDYLTRLGVDELRNHPQMQGLRRRLLTELLGYYEEFIEQHGDDPSTVGELIETRLQVADLLDQVGKRAEAFVAFDQAMRLREKAPGPPPPMPGAFGPPPPRGFARLLYLSQPAVARELKLSAGQQERVAALVDFQGKPPTGAALAAGEKALGELLTSWQAERLAQIVRQSRGPAALLEPDTVKALDLTDKQRQSIQAALPRPRPPRYKGGGPPKGGPPRGGQPAELNWKQVNERALAVLNADQRTRWQAMLGEPFRGPIFFGPPRPHPPRGR